MSRQSNTLFQAMAYLDPELALSAAPKAAERHHRRRPMVIAAALAAAAIFLMGAAGILTHYFSLSGMEIVSNEHHFSVAQPGESPIAVENGRLYFVLDGERRDITALVDENTPYLYTAYNEDGQVLSHFLAGGTPEDWGWIEIWLDGSQQQYVWAGVHGEIHGNGLLGQALDRAAGEDLVSVMGCPWIVPGIEKILAAEP